MLVHRDNSVSLVLLSSGLDIVVALLVCVHVLTSAISHDLDAHLMPFASTSKYLMYGYFLTL